ncbi:MAG: MucB/RseB C-terminal domain-containing protein [Pseudomonadota bacterium]
MSEWLPLNHRNNITLKHFLVFTIFILGCISSTFADTHSPDPQTLIDKMSKASRNLDYDGTFIYKLGKRIDTMRIIHKSGDSGIYERLISLTGNAREVVRDKDQVKCFFPEDKKVIVDKSRTGKLVSTYLPDPISSISEFYHFELAGEGRVAGMNSWIVNIRPNDKYRYGYQLWIEKDSHLLLKSELKNQLGVTLEQVMFTQLQIHEQIDDALLQPSISGEDYVWYNNINDESIEKNNDKSWEVKSMPAGFSMSQKERETMTNNHMPIEHFVYTDGLAMVSIYIEKMEQQLGIKPGSSNFGGVNTYSTNADGYQITAVGEVPKATVELMANSVKSFH